MTLPPDVLSRIDQAFAAEHVARARELLLDMRARLVGTGDFARVIRCVVHLANGDLATLADMTEHACLDWRDVIMWAEYADDERRLRDFNQPFE